MSLSSPRSPDLAAPVVQRLLSEREFYLEEFHGRTVGIAVPESELDPAESLERVVSELVKNETGVVLFSTSRGALERYCSDQILTMDRVAERVRLGGMIWRGLRASGCVGIVISDEAQFAAGCRLVAVCLGLSKLVWIDRDGGLTNASGGRASFVHLAELRAREAASSARRARLLHEVEELLVAGIPAVNVCSLAGLYEELFSYDGSGTLFTLERYVVVRRLGIDDYDAASDLIARGVSEGYLAPRSEAQTDVVLACGFGAFIEGMHLAGIGALIPADQEACAEVASLYTLTRFLGEGVGGHLVQHALEEATRLGMTYVYSCTISERVALFFERYEFRRVAQSEVPSEKWTGYSEERRGSLTCLRRDLGVRATAQ